eukprot:734583-Pelagomonas_calceolata.AAC.5
MHAHIKHTRTSHTHGLHAAHSGGGGAARARRRVRLLFCMGCRNMHRPARGLAGLCRNPRSGETCFRRLPHRQHSPDAGFATGVHSPTLLLVGKAQRRGDAILVFHPPHDREALLDGAPVFSECAPAWNTSAWELARNQGRTKNQNQKFHPPRNHAYLFNGAPVLSEGSPAWNTSVREVSRN